MGPGVERLRTGREVTDMTDCHVPCGVQWVFDGSNRSRRWY